MPSGSKEKNREYQSKWYKQNKETQMKRVAEYKNELYLWYKELKSTLKCEVCGENHPACLEFHHKDPSEKDGEIFKAVHDGWGKERIIKEIDKCKVLCSNCHRKEHYNLGGWGATKDKLII